MQERAQVLIIGGGIVGCSAAYHLEKSGCRDVLLVEKGELTSGSTWHAAGLVGQLRSSRNVTRMLKHSVELYESLEAETGQATGWKQAGGLRLACSEERMQELRKGATTGRSFGLEMHMLSPQDALDLFPIMSPKDIVGAGFNAHGIAAGGGAGRMLSEWIRDGRPSLDLWSVDIRRFGKHHRELDYVRDRTLELYGKHYSIAWPGDEHESGRNLRLSPLHSRLEEQGAVFGSKFGWERANWFAPAGVEAVETPTFGKPGWFEHVGVEHRAIRETVALIDQTPFSKLEVSGPGSFEFLQRLAAANIDKPPGRLTYTQLCNERGGIEADLTIARIEDERFYIVTGTAFGIHDISWIRENLECETIEINDITDTKAVINVCGPRARELLGKVCDDPLDNDSFPFSHCREIRIGNTKALALRVTYVGELGWELHMPMGGAAGVYDLLTQAGEALGVRNASYRAIESCRLEKGYRYWSTDLTADYTPWEAGLGFCVALDKGDFIGREALAKAKEQGATRKMSCFTLEEYRPLNGGETISRGGEVLGVLTSGGYGYTVGQSIAYGYIPSELTAESDFEVEVMGEPVRAIRHDGALYDKGREKILS
ncbi:MAG: FAD-dependent oxidoreductase [Planctomycetota bacterium]